MRGKGCPDFRASDLLSLVRPSKDAPQKNSQLNPVEGIWQFMQDKWPSNRELCDHEDINDHRCHRWMGLHQPATAYMVYQTARLRAWIPINKNSSKGISGSGRSECYP